MVRESSSRFARFFASDETGLKALFDSVEVFGFDGGAGLATSGALRQPLAAEREPTIFPKARPPLSQTEIVLQVSWRAVS